MEEVLAQPDFGAMTRKAEAMLDGNPAIHNSGHGGIGGEMARLYSFFAPSEIWADKSVSFH